MRPPPRVRAIALSFNELMEIMASRSDALPQSPRALAQERDWGGAIFAAILLGAVVVLPSGADFAFGLVSHAPGTAAAILILLLGLVHLVRVDRILVTGFIIGALVVSHLFVARMIVPVDYNRAAGSLILIILLFGAARTYADYAFRLPDVDVARMLAIIRWFLVAAALAAILGIQPPGGMPMAKPVFPFTEPSHFALTFAPFLVDACVRNQGWKRVAWLLVGFGIAYSLENLTLVVAVLVAAAVSVPITRPLPWIVAITFAALILNVEYFAERVDFTRYSSDVGTNLSVLIYIQGWELVQDSFEQTQGWGLGFQQLGLGYVNSPAAEQIFRLERLELNLLDGGLVAAKVISEFGVFGLLATLAFALGAILAGLRLRRIAARVRAAPLGDIFALSIICAFTLNVFVRGLSYFDGTTLLFVAACFHLFTARKATRKRHASDRDRVGDGTATGPEAAEPAA